MKKVDSPTDLYVIVIHEPTRRGFTLDRSYRLLENCVQNAFPSKFGQIERDSKWPGWVPSYEHQRPEWANEIIAQGKQEEFTAWWYEATNVVESK